MPYTLDLETGVGGVFRRANGLPVTPHVAAYRYLGTPNSGVNGSVYLRAVTSGSSTPLVAGQVIYGTAGKVGAMRLLFLSLLIRQEKECSFFGAHHTEAPYRSCQPAREPNCPDIQLNPCHLSLLAEDPPEHIAYLTKGAVALHALKNCFHRTIMGAGHVF